MTRHLKMVAPMTILTALMMVMVKNPTGLNGSRNGRGIKMIL